MDLEKYGIEKKDLLMPGSILIGAILVSASVLLSAGKISWPQNAAAAAQVQGQNVQAPADNGGPVAVADRAGAPKIGTGKVQIVEFSDFQCPFCQRFFQESYGELKTKYVDTGKATLTFRYFPLSFHQNAQKAAEAAECANRQGKFWQYHDTLFKKGQADGTGLAVADLKQYASDLGLDAGKFNSCLDNGEAAATVKQDIADGQKAGVSGTPTVFINGSKIVGAQPVSNFEQAIDAALK